MAKAWGLPPNLGSVRFGWQCVRPNHTGNAHSLYFAAGAVYWYETTRLL